MLFTQRTLLVKDHRGQIAFPGGVRDPEDAHLLATALRETFEEIGLAPEAVEVLGTLPGVATITGYHITPFVGLIPHPYDFQPSPQEVKRLLALPVAEFYPPERWRSGPYVFQGRTTRVCYWHNGQEVVWGATARILLTCWPTWGPTPYRETAMPPVWTDLAGAHRSGTGRATRGRAPRGMSEGKCFESRWLGDLQDNPMRLLESSR